MQRYVHTSTVESRKIGVAMYYRVDPQPSGPLRGRHWMEIDLTAYSGAQVANVAGGIDDDPASLLHALAATGDLQPVGGATVDGRRTTHYRGHVQPAAAQVSIGLVSSALTDVWLTDDGTPVRITRDVSGLQETMDYSRFGTDAPIAIPAASDTADRTADVRAALQKARKKTQA